MERGKREEKREEIKGKELEGHEVEESEGWERNGRRRDNGMGEDGGMGGRDSSDGEIWILEGKSEIKINLYFGYHSNCYDFVNKRKIKAARNKYDQTSCDKAPSNFILRSILNEDNKMWNSIELLDAYKNKGGTESNST